MLDHLIEETTAALHPDSLLSDQTTETLREMMRLYLLEHPPNFWAQMVSAPHWREDRPEMIRMIAGYGWNTVNERAALVAAELHVMAIEAVAALWHPEDCSISAVRIDGKPVISLVCSVEGSM